jgi:hypothetical protein
MPSPVTRARLRLAPTRIVGAGTTGKPASTLLNLVTASIPPVPLFRSRTSRSLTNSLVGTSVGRPFSRLLMVDCAVAGMTDEGRFCRMLEMAMGESEVMGAPFGSGGIGEGRPCRRARMELMALVSPALSPVGRLDSMSPSSTLSGTYCGTAARAVLIAVAAG